MPNIEAGQFQTLAEWGEYASRDWLHPYGSDDAHNHFRGKLEEEQQELITALAQGSPDAIAGEGGDVAWCAAAIALNAGITLTKAIDGSTIGPITAPQEFDQLAQRGLGYWDVPGLKGTRRLSDADVIERMKAGELETLTGAIGELAHQVCASTEMYRKLCKLGPKEGNEPWISLHESRIKEGVSELHVAVAIAARLTDRSLTDVLQITYLKLEGRKKGGGPITKLPRSLFWTI